MKKVFLCMFSLLILLLCSCNSHNEFKTAVEGMESLCGSLGGAVAVYTHNTDTEIPAAVTALYGTEKNAPDELNLVDFAVIWYSKSLSGKDAAVFYVTNATDTESVEKMCLRRQKTVKLTADIDMEIYTNGHFVCIYTDGIPQIEETVKNIAGN